MKIFEECSTVVWFVDVMIKKTLCQSQQFSDCTNTNEELNKRWFEFLTEDGLFHNISSFDPPAYMYNVEEKNVYISDFTNESR